MLNEMKAHPESSSEIKKFYDDNGYYHARNVFSPSEVKELEGEFDRLVRQLTSGKETAEVRWRGDATEKLSPKNAAVIHTNNVQRFSAAWLRALVHPRFLDFATQILGPDVVLHHTKLFQKPAEKGMAFPMHQDWSYFPTIKDTMIAGIIMISEATDDMGCLRVVPGSHKLGRIDKSDGQSDSGIASRFPLENSVPLEGRPGDVLFFHYFTLHGSKPNLSDKIRKSVLVQMHAGDDAVEEGNGHPNEHLTIAGWNSRMTRSVAAAH